MAYLLELKGWLVGGRGIENVGIDDVGCPEALSRELMEESTIIYLFIALQHKC